MSKKMRAIEKKWGFDFLFGEEIIKSIDHFISNPPAYTIMNAGTLDNGAISFLAENFDIGYPLQEKFGWKITNMMIDGNHWDFLKDPENAIKDIVWGGMRNKGYIYEAFHKFDYTDALKGKIVSILEDLRTDLILYRKIEAAHEKAREIETAHAEKEFTVKILASHKGYGGEDGVDPYAKVEITDPNTYEKDIYHCRNIFDFGHVVNRSGGGLLSKDEAGEWFWDLWKKPNVPATDFDVRAVKYLTRFSPIPTGIRM